MEDFCGFAPPPHVVLAVRPVGSSRRPNHGSPCRCLAAVNLNYHRRPRFLLVLVGGVGDRAKSNGLGEGLGEDRDEGSGLGEGEGVDRGGDRKAIAGRWGVHYY